MRVTIAADFFSRPHYMLTQRSFFSNYVLLHTYYILSRRPIWGQWIKLIQVVSTSEFNEIDGTMFILFFFVPSAVAGPQKPQTLTASKSK